MGLTLEKQPGCSGSGVPACGHSYVSRCNGQRALPISPVCKNQIVDMPLKMPIYISHSATRNVCLHIPLLSPKPFRFRRGLQGSQSTQSHTHTDAYSTVCGMKRLCFVARAPVDITVASHRG